ncbi:MAG TPA: cobyrinate a,c-diamide synthase, partial [Acetobacteraceae bacterium]|nr:cobyrinate a,c-diamide synthase [Acetobacteraceae bacterium]
VDGPEGRTGAAADLAARYGLPVLLVLDVAGQAQSAAAVAVGFATHRTGVQVAGVVLNRVGSERHRAQATGAIAAAGLPVLGSLSRDAGVAVPERHLGLVQARELPELAALIARLGEWVARHVDLDAVVALATPPRVEAAAGTDTGALPPPGRAVALAQDAAFSFVYPHMLAGWRAAGAAVLPFSPLADEAPPEEADCCWLPGGYPELHAARLAAAERFRAGLARFAASRPVHGECGGFMVLGARLQDEGGTWHEMAGLLPHATSFAARRMTLGYRAGTTLADSPLGPAGTRLRGHEFHYATLTEPGDAEPLLKLADAAGRPLGAAGSRRGRVSGTFFHAIAGEAA